ncbi:MAG TPA: hypothetical protein DEF18_00260 [Muricauda sp.]|uniref:DUF4382 domain-containing protein n=1 Tax=Flagellimonas aurea TaxID=2915619 RepID=A0ABS3G4K3_9FLAO|nr:DUF4382 domain-containing protein [Allomuricauda aurea]MAO15438.1 hypothetical protein [Allomuricauda sp.]MBO0354315.1 DUF4382 domain-containing protein [Allomuricauda aurea]HBU76510.1 hypothetical protein [Allomuricauda sp.]|tara:strand:- start:696 stop:1589 length:894 start_codon:yes stop_codon:yes gene_type:complete
MRTKIFSSLFAVMTLFFVSCSDDEGNGGNPQGTGTLSVQLTDAPFPYELVAEANVTVYKVEARRVSEDDDDDALTVSPYITLMEEEIETNLLELTNGLTLQLAEIEVPVGTYDQVRVYVKGVNVVLTDGTVYDLKVPSGDSSGIKVFIDPGITVVGGLSSDLLLDFDVSRSFVAKGNLDVNGFNFKPVIKASNLSTAGTLAGNVSTIEEETQIGLFGAQVSVFAADTLNMTSFTDPDGNYTILGLEAGTYEVVSEFDGFIASDTLEVQINAANVTTQDFILEVDPAATEEETTEGGN